MLATRFGVAAIDCAHDGGFGQMVALQSGGDRPGAARSAAVGELKTVDPDLLEIAELFYF